MIYNEEEYLTLLEYVLENGQEVSDRTGIGTKSVFGQQLRFDLKEGFPALTTKKLAWKSVVGELLFFLEGSTDERRLVEITYGKPREELVDKRTIWTDNANNQGVALGYQNDDLVKELGPIYGYQWRNFFGVDQIQRILHLIKNDPDSRRIMLSAWNPAQANEMALEPCHCSFQFKVYDDQLSCMMTMRSTDSFLGLPFNIASYALLTHIIARECGLKPNELIINLGDVHIYLNHLDQVKEQLSREPFPSPILEIDEDFDLTSIINSPWAKFPLNSVGKFRLVGYNSHNTIKAPMAI